jgi:hypothetical protein
MFRQLIIITTTIDKLISHDLIEDAKEILKNCDLSDEYKETLLRYCKNEDYQSYRYVAIEEAGIYENCEFEEIALCRFIGHSAAMSRLAKKKIIQKYFEFNAEQEWSVYKCVKDNKNCTHKNNSIENNSVGELDKWISILDNNRENK